MGSGRGLGRWVIWVLLAAPLASCDSDVLTPAEIRATCEQDLAVQCCENDDCASGSICYVSVVCGLRPDHVVSCSPPMGDHRCHATCDASHPCPGGQACQAVTLFDSSDAGHGVSICAATP